MPALPEACDILLVQDNPLEVELTLRPLREVAPEAVIGVAGDGEEALDYLLARGEYRHRLGGLPPRLVLLDLKLPKLDGIEVLRAVRASHRAGAVPVVMLIPASEPRELAQCYQLGVNSCVRKPVHYAEFTGTLQAIGRYWLGINQPPAGVEAPVGQRAPAR